MENFIKYYLELKDKSYNIRLITAKTLSAKTKIIDKDRKGISPNRISDLKNMSHNVLKNKITIREKFLIQYALYDFLGVHISNNDIGLDPKKYVNIDINDTYYNIHDIKKAWNKKYKTWFKDGYNIECIFSEFINELNNNE